MITFYITNHIRKLLTRQKNIVCWKGPIMLLLLLVLLLLGKTINTYFFTDISSNPSPHSHSHDLRQKYVFFVFLPFHEIIHHGKNNAYFFPDSCRQGADHTAPLEDKVVKSRWYLKGVYTFCGSNQIHVCRIEMFAQASSTNCKYNRYRLFDVRGECLFVSLRHIVYAVHSRYWSINTLFWVLGDFRCTYVQF